MNERLLLLQGKQMAREVRSIKNPGSLAEVEFSVFSQFGDDGIIQWLLGNINVANESFVEFGVGKYLESNTRFLLMNDNWSGFVMDSSAENIAQIKSDNYFWRHDLQAREAFVTTKNVNELVASSGFAKEIGLLHIDLDGCDYWIWQALDTIEASVVIMEYNSVFGAERSITVPYREDFYRTRAHYSNLYFGSSLKALINLATQKNYAFIGSNQAGNNAYFVQRKHLNSSVREISLREGYREAKFRESRNESGELTYLRSAQRLEAIRGLPVINSETGGLEKL